MSIETLTVAILSKMSGIGKWQSNFFIELVQTWLSLKGRFNFDNLARQGKLSAESYRNNFSNTFDFKEFNKHLFDYLGEEKTWAFDPSFISKSGKKTNGIGYFWSGCAQKVKRGLEIAGLAVVDVKNHTAFHYYATQTCLEDAQNLISYYADLLTKDAANLLAVSKYVTVDAYFSKITFIDPLCKHGLEVITRLRDDAVMFYAYKGEQRSGRGRKKKFAGKIDVKNLDSTQFSVCIKDKKWTAFESLVYVKSLKRWVKAVVVQNYKADESIKNCKIFISTDTSLPGVKVYHYYHLRFQIEFIYRDGKQHLGLTHCQSTQSERLNFQFNFSLTILSLAKIVHSFNQPLEERKPFSIYDIKTQYFNERFLNIIFSALGIDAEQQNNNPKVLKLFNYAKIAA